MSYKPVSKRSGAFWNLNSTSNSPVAQHRLSCQISANQHKRRNERGCKQTLKNMCQARVMIIISNVISADQHFASTFSMQIFKFHRCSCKLYFLFSPATRLPQRAYLQASVKCGNNMSDFRKCCHAVKVIYMYCVIYQRH